MVELHEIQVVSHGAPWERLGFVLRPDESASHSGEWVISVPDLDLRIREPRVGSEAAGVTGWVFRSVDGTLGDLDGEIDGIPTRIIRHSSQSSSEGHRLGVVGVDHVVVMTGSLDRTCADIANTLGSSLRRIRDAGNGIRQGFHRFGRVIVEVVERPDLGSSPSASLWGLVFTVADLDEVVDWLGPDVIGSPRDAVQPGRRIATLRSGLGLGVPIALITPEV